MSALIISPPTITGVSPTTGVAGVQVTVSGSGFGSAQGTGTVWLGSTPGVVVNWSDTQIVADVASNATSGSARVRQNGAWSNAVPFNVNTATIATVTPASGVPGTQVTIAGSSFGDPQGSGQVWLGTANAVVQTWSDTQIVALVASGSASGNALVLQNGVMSNPVPFAVNTLHLTSIDPNSGAAGTSVTFTGAGFGSSQGSGVAWLGSTAGQVVTWSDTQVVATVASTALTGVARIQQNGVWSNALAFTVPSEDGVTLMPSLINMMVGDTHAIQALSAAGQPVTGLTWTSSDPTVVSLSSDDPPVLTALAPGHVTITAGTASADVTVSSPTDFPSGLPLGTVLWSHPGDVYSILPAVPSPSGVADVFAYQRNDTIQAITSDGTTAWTADVSQAQQLLPDFQGGLVVQNRDGSVVRFDGITGQPRTLYTPPNNPDWNVWSSVAVHPDGTVFVLHFEAPPGDSYEGHSTVIGIDSATGAQKFSVPVPVQTGEGNMTVQGILIAGDGHAYVQYFNNAGQDSSETLTCYLHLLRVSSSGASDDILAYQWGYVSWDRVPSGCAGTMLTNADTGVVLTGLAAGFQGSKMAITNGTGVSVVYGPEAPNDWPVVPVLQAQDGSFIGTAGTGLDSYMVAFDATGGVRWSVPNYTPLMATADGGVIATIDGVSATIFDKNGGATGQMARLPTQSWTMNEYQIGSVDLVVAMALLFAPNWSPFEGANASGNGTAHFPKDSIANDKVHKILTPAMWQKFAGSHCAAVLGDPLYGLPSTNPYYSLVTVQMKQGMTNFYDVGNPGIGDLAVRTVTGGKWGSNETITAWLGNADAGTAYMGYTNQTAIVLKAGFFSQAHPEFVLVHELLVHAYSAWGDDNMFGFFQDKGLWRPANSNATYYISTWMSTDCKCTPQNPATAGTCTANTAQW